MELLDITVLGNDLRAWGIAVLSAVLVTIAVNAVVRTIASRLRAYAERHRGGWAQIGQRVLDRTQFVVYLALALYAASLPLDLPPRARAVVTGIGIVVLLLQAGIWGIAAVDAWLERYRSLRLAVDPSAVTTMGALVFVSKLVVWAAVLLLVLDNVGVDITALVAGLGIGGIAVALAVQNILGDLFASLSIVLDKPFVLGDFLSVGEHLGSVEAIGLKTTRLRSLSGEQLVFANSDLLSSRIRNYGRMFERRALFAIGVTYQTPRAKLEHLPGILREAVEAQARTRFDRAHFKEFGSFSLNFEVVYYVLDRDYNLYMDIQQAINLRIHERFDAEGIDFAYPTQTLFVQTESQPAAA